MKSWEQDIIVRNYEYLLETTVCDDALVSKLREKGLLSNPDLHELIRIGKTQGNFAQVVWLYKQLKAQRFTLQRRPTFDVLIEALNESGQVGPTNVFWQERDEHYQYQKINDVNCTKQPEITPGQQTTQNNNELLPQNHTNALQLATFPKIGEKENSKEPGSEYTYAVMLTQLTVKLEQPLPHTAQNYPNGSIVLPYRNKGLALIINIRNFSTYQLHDEEMQHTRHGSEFDAMNLKTLFKLLGYRIFQEDQINWNDQSWTKQQILEMVEHFQAYCNQEKPNSIIVFIGSHGEFDGILTSDPPTISTQNGIEVATYAKVKLWEDIIRPFYDDKCPGLQNKVKLFFISACQVFCGSSEGDFISSKGPPVTNLLVFAAQAPGFVAFRNTQSGSRFAHCLTYFLMKYAKDKSLMEIVHLVVDALKDKIARIEFPDGSVIEHGQVPVYSNCGLTRPVYFAVEPGIFSEKIKLK